nr:unnamed protein product [Digitaria exilis]
MAAQPPPAPLAVEARFADLCKELGLEEGVAGEAAALLDEVKGALLATPSVGGRSAKDAERLCFAFVLYCAVKLKGRKEGCGVRLFDILKGCKLKSDDFFQELQQLSRKIEDILESRYGQDWEGQLELKQLENLVDLLAAASRFYRRVYYKLFSSASTNQEPGLATNNLDYFLFGWHLFAMLRSRSPELFKNLVSCVHGLVAVLAILLIHVPAKSRSFTIEGSSHLNGLMWFKGLIDEESFQHNLEKLEKQCNPDSWEGEFDLKLFLSDDYFPSAEGAYTKLGCSKAPQKRAFEILASPTKTIKNMLTVPCSPSSPANDVSVKTVQMTPVTSAMTTAKWLREAPDLIPSSFSSTMALSWSPGDCQSSGSAGSSRGLQVDGACPPGGGATRMPSWRTARHDNTDPRSPKRPCNESRNTGLDCNLQTPPPKQSHIVLAYLKAKCHPLQSTFASPTVSNPVGGDGNCADITVQIFFSKILKLAAIRIRNLCERVQYVEQTECVYNVFKQILDQQTALFFNRHIDQIILCCLYGVAKVRQLDLSFKEILNNYKREPQCKPEIFLSIYVGSRNRNGVLGSHHLDIIPFYNQVFVPAAKPFLVSLMDSGTCSEDKNANSMCYISQFELLFLHL